MALPAPNPSLASLPDTQSPRYSGPNGLNSVLVPPWSLSGSPTSVLPQVTPCCPPLILAWIAPFLGTPSCSLLPARSCLSGLQSPIQVLPPPDYFFSASALTTSFLCGEGIIVPTTQFSTTVRIVLSYLMMLYMGNLISPMTAGQHFYTRTHPCILFLLHLASVDRGADT